MDDATALQFFNSYFGPAKNHQEGLADNWTEYESAYLGEDVDRVKPTGDDSWRSFFFQKYGWQQVQTLAAELAADDDPTFVYEPHDYAQQEFARTVSCLVGYQLQRDDYPAKRLMAAIITAVYGGCPLKVHWDYQTATRMVLKPSGLREETRIVVRDQPTITIIDPYDFYYDTRARTMRECRYAFHRMRLSFEELEARERSDGSKLYKNLDELRDKFRGVGGGSGSHDTGREWDNDLSGEKDKANNEGIEIVEMWTRDRLIVVASGGVVIRNEPNPFHHGRIPFEVATIQPSLNDVWGMSVMWALRDIQEILWTLDNSALDALKKIIDPPYEVDIMADGDNVNRSLRPGQAFPKQGQGAGAVAPIRITGAEPFVTEGAIQSVRDQMKQITGVTDEIAGMSGAGTATQAAINQRQAKGRIGVMLRSMDQAFARCADMYLQLNQQFMDFSRPIRVLGSRGGSEWRHIAPSEIAGLWDVRAKNSSERVVKELRRQNLIEAIGALSPSAGIPNPDGTVVNLSPLQEELVESFGLPVDRVIVPMSGLMAVQEEQAVSQARAQVKAMEVMPPEPEAEAAPAEAPVEQDLNEQVRLTYKDMDADAKMGVLQQLGLPVDGVLEQAAMDAEEQEARTLKLRAEAARAQALVEREGYSSGQSARRDVESGDE